MDRREPIKLGAGAVASGFTVSAAGAASTTVSAVEQWCVFEFNAKGPSSGNPFVEVSFGALLYSRPSHRGGGRILRRRRPVQGAILAR